MDSTVTSRGAAPPARVAWYSEPTKEQWRTLFATWAGWVLDAFDFTLLLLVLGEVAKTFGVDLVAMGSVITGTLFMRMAGGLVFGTWADRVGRRLPMMISILTYSVMSFCSGLAPDYTTFLIIRLIFGMGMGGEYAAGTPLVMENWPNRSRGFASGIVQGGWPVGYLLATIVYFLVFPTWGWRPLFFIGFLPALLVVYIRTAVPESPVWQARRDNLQKAKRSDELSLIRLFRRDLVLTTLHAFIFMGAIQFSYYCMSSLWPTYLTSELKLDVNQKTTYLIFLNVASLFGFWSSGIISQRIGRRGAITLFAFVGIVFLPLYTGMMGPTLVLVGGILVGFIGIGVWGVLPAYLSERFPTSVRGVGPGLAFNVGATIGSFAPTIQAIFIREGATMGQAILVGGAAALAVLTVVTFLGPEPKGREFTAET